MPWPLNGFGVMSGSVMGSLNRAWLRDELPDGRF